MIEPHEQHWVADHVGPEARLEHSAKRDMALRNDGQLDFEGAIRDEVERRNESLRYRRMLDGTQIQSPIVSDNRKSRPSYEREKVNVWRLLSSTVLASFAIVLLWYNIFVDVPSVVRPLFGISESRAGNWVIFISASLAAAPYVAFRKKPSREKSKPALPSILAEQVSLDRQRELFIEDHATEKEQDWKEHQEFISYDAEAGKRGNLL